LTRRRFCRRGCCSDDRAFARQKVARGKAGTGESAGGAEAKETFPPLAPHRRHPPLMRLRRRAQPREGKAQARGKRRTNSRLAARAKVIPFVSPAEFFWQAKKRTRRRRHSTRLCFIGE